MSNEVGTVNSQILDSTTGVITLLSGQAPSQAFSLLDAVMAETLGMAMHNAVSRQQGAGVISSAAVTAACAKMLVVPFPILPPLPISPLPPNVDPLPGPPPDLSPAAAEAAAFVGAEAAIDVLKATAAGGSSLSQTAQADLDQLITDAGGTPPTPPDPVPEPPAVVVPTAFAAAETAIDALKAQAANAARLAQTAQADLNKLITEAGGTPPPSPVPPAPAPTPPGPDAKALADAEAAITTLKTQAANATQLSQAAQADLNKLITEAGGTPPTPPT
jgi:hypothetical protein